ncbi:MAG: addiction module protein [Ignavibacteriae bacterium]|nr:addiction module protein [Ignavibacteriota bacterium]
MSTSEIIREVEKLNISDKILLVEDIWDSIAKSDNKLPLLEWQKLELDKRYKDFKDGKLNLHRWKNVHSELRQKLK